MTDQYFQDRSTDIYDVSMRVILNLLGKNNETEIGENKIVVAYDLTPSEAISYTIQDVKGIVLAKGGVTSHSVILAKSMGIPCVVGVKELLDNVSAGQRLIIDGVSGRVLVNPNPKLVKEYRKRMRVYKEFLDKMDELGALDAVTKDEQKIQLLANVGVLSDLHFLQQFGAMGIGLYRTEFPFMARNSLPTVEEQYEIYTKIIEALPDKEVVIRTLDLGGDKFLSYLDLGQEENPYLGWRSIRISLELTDLFKVQLKALMMASAHGNLHILFPMISELDEVRKIKKILSEVKNELRRERIAFREDVPFGIMVEVPSAVICLDLLIDEVDFLSIGTNDLIQYTLAVDRNNEKVANYYEPMHPAIIRMIEQTIQIAKVHKKPVTLCGEMAADPKCTPLLLGLGLERFSMGAPNIPIIKEVIRRLDMKYCEEVVTEVKKFRTAREIREYLDSIYNLLGLESFFEKLSLGKPNGSSSKVATYF